MPRELHIKSSARNIFGNRVYRRVRFQSRGLWVMGPPCGFFYRSSDILHGHDSKACQRVACQLCRQHRRYQGRGAKRTIFLLVERGGPIGKVLVHRWLPECHQQKQQGLTDRVVHRGVYISSKLLLLRSYRSQERLNKTILVMVAGKGSMAGQKRDYCLPTGPLCGTWSIEKIWICAIILM